MNVSIAREGTEIGEYPREKLGELARSRKVRPTDYYWHEGMDGWLILGDLLGRDAWSTKTAAPAAPPVVASLKSTSIAPPTEGSRSVVPAPAEGRKIFAIAACGIVLSVVVGSAIYFVRLRNSEHGSAPLFSTSSATPGEIADPNTIRDAAVADLKQRIERLPGGPVPPLHTFYYDVEVKMQKTIFERTPWTAIVRGAENVVDPVTGDTNIRTDFALTIDYTDGKWTFRNYRASVSDMVQKVTNEVEENANAPVPPSIVGILGLKRNP